MVGGCASHQVALHLMRAGAAGILGRAGTGFASTTRAVLGLGPPQATAIADVAGARRRHLEETGVYAQVIADGGMTTGGDIAKAIVCGADAVMIGAPLAAASEAPGHGWYWDMSAGHASLPRGGRVPVPVQGTLAEVLLGPAPPTGEDGRVNLFGRSGQRWRCAGTPPRGSSTRPRWRSEAEPCPWPTTTGHPRLDKRRR